jgi:hypothetical protein
MAVSKFSEISFNGIKEEIERYLTSEFSKASILYSPASPYGQILSVVQNLHQLSILYLKNAINQFDLSRPSSTNARIIRNAAIYAGHNPTRGISATGTLRFSLKPNIDLDKEVPGQRITIENKFNIKNKTNNLDYSINMGVERMTHILSQNYTFFVPIIQGKWERRTFTGNGSPLQTISLSEIGGKDVENFNVEVLVNGVLWTIKKHIWDMIPDEEACVVKTGFTGGIDIVFGNGGFGGIPPLASSIQVNYLVTNGSDGNIFRRTRDDWKFIDDIIDGNGESINVEKVFNVDIYTDINFGSNAESIEFTKSILPLASNNFVLATPQQYAYEIKKLGVFSHVNAYERTGSIFIVATPNIKLFKNQNANYFTVDLRAFELDSYEKRKIDQFLKSGGNIQLTKKYRIDSPKLSFYVMNINFISYSDALDISVSAQILEKISDYFLNLRRIDRVPKLDIIRELSSISDIHSVEIQFISKKNEDYHAENKRRNETAQQSFNSNFANNPSAGRPDPNYDPNVTLGLDNELGDIIFEANEIPVIRGGWSDRNGVMYQDIVDGIGMKSVNIYKKGSIDSKNRPS